MGILLAEGAAAGGEGMGAIMIIEIKIGRASCRERV